MKAILKLAVVVVCLAACGVSDKKITPDSGTDTDTDADTDTDTDTDTTSYWDWQESDIPNEIYNAHDDFLLWAADVDDVVVCSGDDQGGLAEFNGASFTVSTLPSGIGVFGCEGVWGNGTDVWAWGFLGFDYDEFRVLRRDGAAWVEEPVEGFEDCASAPEYCHIQAMFADGVGAPRATGWSDADWDPPVVGARVVWERQVATESWTVDTGAVFPGFDTMEWMCNIVSGSVPVWVGAMDSVSKVLEVAAGIVDLGYPQSEWIRWLDRDGAGGLVASTGFDLLRYDGVTWNVEASTTCDPGPLNTCWNIGAVDADGAVYLGDGRGGFGDGGSGQWWLHRWDGENLAEILEPCPEPNPSCGITDVTVVGNRIYAVGRRDYTGVLLWADIP